jgi:hypothetical protein
VVSAEHAAQPPAAAPVAPRGWPVAPVSEEGIGGS